MEIIGESQIRNQSNGMFVRATDKANLYISKSIIDQYGDSFLVGVDEENGKIALVPSSEDGAISVKSRNRICAKKLHEMVKDFYGESRIKVEENKKGQLILVGVNND